MLITFLASILIWVLVGTSLITVRRPLAIRALTAFVIALVAAQSLKLVIPSPRPFVLGAATPLTLTVHYDNAFPSGHTAAAFALAVTVLFYNRRLGIIFVFVAALVGVSRVWANVHWPIDIVGGAVLGTVVAIVLNKFTTVRN
jgi:undecaprenyl-diphosphatase